MLKVERSKFITIALIFSFILFYSPHLLRAEANKEGSLIGFVYHKDGTTPVEGAVLKIKNVEDGTMYQSSKSDSQGEFKIKEIKEGIYLAGITTSEGNFSFSNLIGIKKDKEAKVAFSLVPSDELDSVPESEELPISNETEIGKVVEYKPETSEAAVLLEEGKLRLGDTIRIKGETVDFYQDVESLRIGSDYVESASAGQTPMVKVISSVQEIDSVYLVREIKVRPFLFSPIGIITVLSATSGLVYGVVKLSEEEAEVSPFKK